MVLYSRPRGTMTEKKTGYSHHKEEFIMKVTVERDGWYDYKKSAWDGAISTLNEVAEQGREDEAVEIIEEYMSEGALGYIPSETEVNDFIWFNLPDIMHLYDEDDDEDDDNDEDDEDDKEYEEDEE